RGMSTELKTDRQARWRSVWNRMGRQRRGGKETIRSGRIFKQSSRRIVTIVGVRSAPSGQDPPDRNACRDKGEESDGQPRQENPGDDGRHYPEVQTVPYGRVAVAGPIAHSAVPGLDAGPPAVRPPVLPALHVETAYNDRPCGIGQRISVARQEPRGSQRLFQLVEKGL